MPTTPIAIRTFLAGMPLFNELVPAELERIESGTRRVECARGEVLFRRGDPSEGFYTVIFGQMKLAFTSPSGAEKVVEVMGPGQSFGEAMMFLEEPCLVNAITAIIMACVVDLPMTAPVCRSFWMWNLWAALAVAVLSAAIVVGSALRYRAKIAAAAAAEAARQAVDHDAIEELRWKGDA